MYQQHSNKLNRFHSFLRKAIAYLISFLKSFFKSNNQPTSTSDLYQFNLNSDASEDFPQDIITSELLADIRKALKVIRRCRSIALLDAARIGSTTFLRKLMEQAVNEISDLVALFISMANVNSVNEYIDMWITSILSAVSENDRQRMSLAAEHLSRFEYDVRSVFDKDGVKHYFFHIHLGDDLLKAIEELLIIGKKICSETGCPMLICIDDFDYVKNLDEGEQLIALLNKHLWNQKNVSVVTATQSITLQHELVAGIKESKCERMFPTPLSNESVKVIMREYITSKCTDVPEPVLAASLEMLSQLSQGNLRVAFKLAHLSLLMSNNSISTAALEKAFYYMLTTSASAYKHQTAALPQNSRQVLKLLASGQTFNDDHTLEKFNLASKNEANQVRDTLIDSGILVKKGNLCRFADPIYQYWIHSRYTQNALVS